MNGQETTLSRQQQPQPAVPKALAALEHLRTRPDSGPTSWTHGPYGYDGAGNIAAIGSETYLYDKIGRLHSAKIGGPDLSTMQTQTFDYDIYGNLIATSRVGQTVNLPASTLTNQLRTVAYDNAGNVIASAGEHFGYDALGMMNTIVVGSGSSPAVVYGYTADDERLFSFNVDAGVTHWTLRGLDNKVLRDFKQAGGTWTLERDYVYRDGLLLAAMKADGAVEHYSLDHLGSPRLVTDGAGHKIGYHVYWPYGEEWTVGTPQAGSPLQFTGHERDAGPTAGTMPLDYMHARHYSAGWGRFLSPDPAWSSADLGRPQSWNRYSYVENNPVQRTDPTGRCGQAPGVDLVPCPLSGALSERAARFFLALPDLARHNFESSAVGNQVLGAATGNKERQLYGQVQMLHEALTLGLVMNMEMTTESQTVDTAAAVAEDVGLPAIAQKLTTAGRVGASLKADVPHRAASFGLDAVAEAGQGFAIKGKDGVVRTLIQAPGSVNGKVGIFEYIYNAEGRVTHQRFIEGGVVTGSPNQKVQ